MDPLRQWVVNVGKVQIGKEIVAQAIPSMGGGVGVVATKAIPAGHTIVDVPLPFMLTTRSARQYLGALSPGPTPSALQALTPVEVIMSFLVVAEHDAQHPFYPWLNALPKHYDNLLELPFPTFLSGRATDDEEQIAEAGAAYDAAIKPFVWSRRCREKCVEERLRFEASVLRCKACIPQLRRVGEAEATTTSCASTPAAMHRDDDDNETADRTRCNGSVGPIPTAKFLWAYNSLMSRGFAYDDDIWAMMPWVDYFNYSLFPNVTMRFNDKRRRYEFITKRPIAAGVQLLLQYGTYSDFELALWYGFSLTNVLFPNGAEPKRRTAGSAAAGSETSGRDAAEDEELVLRNTHDAYVFSPTYDPNGDLPVGLGWAIALAAQASLAVPEAWCTSQGHDAALLDVRIAWGCINAGMQYLIRRLVDANPALSSASILHRIVASELETFEPPPRSTTAADIATTTEAPPIDVFSPTRLAVVMSECQVSLLRRFVAMDETELRHLIDG